MILPVATETSGRGPRFRNSRTASRAHRNWPVRLTPINRSAWDTPEAEAKLLELIPYYRVGVPGDIGKAAVWLASDDSDYVTGVTLFVDGGMTLYPGFATGG